AGPLPIRGGQFYVRTTGKARLFLSGTAWQSDTGKPCGVSLSATDSSGRTIVSQLAKIYANEANTHKTLVSLFSDEFNVSSGTYFFSVTAYAVSRTEFNDGFASTFVVYVAHMIETM